MKYKNLLLSAALVVLGFGCASHPDERHCEISPRNYSSSDEITVNTTYYGGKKPAAKSIIIMPPTGGTNYIDRRYAAAFCEAGFDVYIVDNWSHKEFDTIELNRHQLFYARSRLALTELLKGVPEGFVGILGTSAGGLTASIAVQTQPRIRAAFLIVTGTPIIDIVMGSDQEAMLELRKARYQKLGYKNDTDLLADLRKAFTLEPQQLGDQFKDKIIGVSIATSDSTVPTSTQIALKELFKAQKVITYDSSHFWGIVKTWLFDTSDIVSFFDQAAQVK